MNSSGNLFKTSNFSIRYTCLAIKQFWSYNKTVVDFTDVDVTICQPSKVIFTSVFGQGKYHFLD